MYAGIHQMQNNKPVCWHTVVHPAFQRNTAANWPLSSVAQNQEMSLSNEAQGILFEGTWRSQMDTHCASRVSHAAFLERVISLQSAWEAAIALCSTSFSDVIQTNVNFSAVNSLFKYLSRYVQDSKKYALIEHPAFSRHWKCVRTRKSHSNVCPKYSPTLSSSNVNYLNGRLKGVIFSWCHPISFDHFTCFLIFKLKLHPFENLPSPLNPVKHPQQTVPCRTLLCAFWNCMKNWSARSPSPERILKHQWGMQTI